MKAKKNRKREKKRKQKRKKKLQKYTVRPQKNLSMLYFFYLAEMGGQCKLQKCAQ